MAIALHYWLLDPFHTYSLSNRLELNCICHMCKMHNLSNQYLLDPMDLSIVNKFHCLSHTLNHIQHIRLGPQISKH